MLQAVFQRETMCDKERVRFDGRIATKPHPVGAQALESKQLLSAICGAGTAIA
jgi:hypothetical protein